MQTAIIDATNIDTSVFSYSAPKANPAGGKVVNLLNKNLKESLTLALPLMLTWGAQEGKDQNQNPTGKYTMSLQFPNKEYSNPDAEACLLGMRATEAKIKADAITYSKEWFGKTITSPDVMEEKFNVMLRHPKLEKGSAEVDLTKPPTLTVKLPCWKGVWQSEIYDEDGEPLFIKGKSPPDVTPLDFIKSKSHVICLIQCGGLWFVNGKVSITWNLKQAIVQKPKTSSIKEGVCFLKPKASDKEKLKLLSAAADEDIIDINDVPSTLVEDSDEEEDFELPPPPPELKRHDSVVAPVETTQVETVADVHVETVAPVEEVPKKKTVVKKVKSKE